MGYPSVFRYIKVLVNFFLLLPFSNALVKRVFNKLKNLKTDHRNNLSTKVPKASIITKRGIL